MKHSLINTIFFCALALCSIPFQKALADVTIVAQEASGGVIFTYSGSLRSNQLASGHTLIDYTPTGRVAPTFPQVEFAPNGGALPSGMTDYWFVVSSRPTNFGTGSTQNPTSFAGDYFGVDYWDVSLPNGYIDGTPISGSMTFAGATFASMGLTPASLPYVWVLDNGETVSLLITGGSPDNAVKTALEKKIKKLKSKLKKAKRSGKKGKAKKFKKKIKTLKMKLSLL